MKENRRNVWKRLSAGLLVIAMAVTLAFGGWSGEAKAAVKPKLSKTSAAMYPGQSTKLKVKNTSAKIKWSSSNKKIAKVSSKGTVKAVKLGKCTITAKVKVKKLKCKVAVVTKENYRARKLYELVQEKGVDQGEGMYILSMSSKKDKKYVDLIAYSKKWEMGFNYIDTPEKSDEMIFASVGMNIVKDKDWDIELRNLNGKKNHTIYMSGKIAKTYDGTRNGLKLTQCLEGPYIGGDDENDLDYSGKMREKDWTKAVSYTKTAFKYYDKLLGKYGYSMKKIGFTKY